MTQEPTGETPLTPRESAKLTQSGLPPADMAQLRERAQREGHYTEDPDALRQAAALRYALLHSPTEQERNPQAAAQAAHSRTPGQEGWQPAEHREADTPQALLATMRETYQTLAQEMRGQPARLLPDGKHRATRSQKLDDDTLCVVDRDDDGKISVTVVQQHQYPTETQSTQPPAPRSPREVVRALLDPLTQGAQVEHTPPPATSRNVLQAHIRPSGLADISQTYTPSEGDTQKEQTSADIRKGKQSPPDAPRLVSAIQSVARAFTGK